MTQEQIDKYKYYQNKMQKLEEKLNEYNKLNEMIKIKKEGGLFYELECRIHIKLYDCGSDGNHWSIKDELKEKVNINDAILYFDFKQRELMNEIQKCKEEIKKI